MRYTDFYKHLREEEHLSEDYPTAWNKHEFEKIRSFNGKLKYAKQHLQLIASGSGRSVFKIDDKKALKIAKNEKGLAQNRVEADPYIANYDITTISYDRGDDVRDLGPFWVEMELAKKVIPSRFAQITGVTIRDLQLFFTLRDGYFKPKVPEGFEEKMDNNEFVMDVQRLMADYDMPIGDLVRISSFGEVIREGKPKIVLVDFGLTHSVYDDFYKVRM